MGTIIEFPAGCGGRGWAQPWMAPPREATATIPDPSRRAGSNVNPNENQGWQRTGRGQPLPGPPSAVGADLRTFSLWPEGMFSDPDKTAGSELFAGPRAALDKRDARRLAAAGDFRGAPARIFSATTCIAGSAARRRRKRRPASPRNSSLTDKRTACLRDLAYPLIGAARNFAPPPWKKRVRRTYAPLPSPWRAGRPVVRSHRLLDRQLIERAATVRIHRAMRS